MESLLFEFSEERLSSLRNLGVIGDLHGDYDTLQSVLTTVDLKEDFLVFLGDYADRGACGVEVIDAIKTLMKKHPKNVVALKGNHEEFSASGEPTFYPCTLREEAEAKRENWQRYFTRELQPFLGQLYVAAIVPYEILFVHGGISRKIESLDNLRHPTAEMEKDLLWSDPFEGRGEHPNRRGAGVEFGTDISEEVCRVLGVKRIIRSHEPLKALTGPHYSHDNRVITTSCTTVYGGNPFILLVDVANFSEITHQFI